MKKTYQKPQLDISIFEVQDVVTISIATPDNDVSIDMMI